MQRFRVYGNLRNKGFYSIRDIYFWFLLLISIRLEDIYMRDPNQIATLKFPLFVRCKDGHFVIEKLKFKSISKMILQMFL